MKFQIFDPPMCCSTGVCGPAVDPRLVAFAADLEWLARHDVQVERFNLAQQPAAFVANPAVKAALAQHGNECLPLVVVDGEVVAGGRYPTRAVLAWLAELPDGVGLFTESVKELVAIGASIAANCEPCFEYHEDKARKLGVSDEDMWQAVETAQMVKDTPARAVLKLAERHLRRPPVRLPVAGGCGCSEPEAASPPEGEPAAKPRCC
jgi:AhpD family alkylhydroperoxidase